jgi:hypothetical protein
VRVIPELEFGMVAFPRRLTGVILAALVLTTFLSSCKKNNATAPTSPPPTEYKQPPPQDLSKPEAAFVQYRRKPDAGLLNSLFVPSSLKMIWKEHKDGKDIYRAPDCYYSSRAGAPNVWMSEKQTWSCFQFDGETGLPDFPIDTVIQMWVGDGAFSNVYRAEEFIINGVLLPPPTLTIPDSTVPASASLTAKFKFNKDLNPYW